MAKKRNVPTSIDKHPQAPEIEAALAAGTPLLKIKARYGVHESALCRHRQRMRREQPEVFAALIASNWKVTPDEMEALRAETADGYLKNLRAHHAKLTHMFDRNFEAGNDGIAAQISAQLNKWSDQIGRTVHQIGADTIRIQQNILVMPEYVALRTAVMEELRGHPEIRARIVQRLREIGEREQQTISLPVAGMAA